MAPGLSLTAYGVFIRKLYAGRENCKPFFFYWSLAGPRPKQGIFIIYLPSVPTHVQSRVNWNSWKLHSLQLTS